MLVLMPSDCTPVSQHKPHPEQPYNSTIIWDSEVCERPGFTKFCQMERSLLPSERPKEKHAQDLRGPNRGCGAQLVILRENSLWARLGRI